MGKLEQKLPESVGPYSIVQSLGKGGMGEVYLAKDPVCSRHIALKRVRPELKESKTIQSRFLREAEVASALSHPSIIPILSIQTAPPDIYYTMPFVEGMTLRQILRSNKGEIHPVRNSIPSLVRIFLQVCEAVAYTHSKGILHRDLKPENIIIGKYGEVMILDWGIADFIDQIGDEEIGGKEKALGENLTRPGKITGTLAYMAPERLLGKSSSVQTDLYALGVILYQMLTLELPFQRKNLAAFRKSVPTEELTDPIELAPYRDIPLQLSEVCRRCLAKSPKTRYKTAEELIREIKNYIEGKPLWVLATELKPDRKSDWMLQENVLLAKNIAITRSLDVTEWAAMMISKSEFASNLRLGADLLLEKQTSGVGFLLNVPDLSRNLEEGYCIWVGHSDCKLFRNNVLLLETKITEPKSAYKIAIEKIDDHLKVFIDGKLKLGFSSHLPFAGSRVGLLHKDGHFQIKNFKIYDASHNAMVGCLAVPNAFLSLKLYDTALSEYRKIGQSFPGRMEGREALFRAGLTLIEKGRFEQNDHLYHLALKEFEKLYRTPGAPLEYLGKSLVYKELSDVEEEAKCLELALRKFPNHPLLPMLKEHIVYRMHESSLVSRESAYRIILLAIRHIPDLFENPDTCHLIDSLEKNWESLPFIQKSDNRTLSIAIQLAFWLAKIPILIELATSVKEDEVLFNNALVCLQELEAKDALQKFLPKKASKKKTLVAWNLLLSGKLSEAKTLFEQYPEARSQETSPLHFPYGTFLYMTQGKEAAMRHFNSVLETPYPPTTALPSLFLTARLEEGWMEQAFWWEKKELHRQIELFYRCVPRNPKSAKMPGHE